MSEAPEKVKQSPGRALEKAVKRDWMDRFRGTVVTRSVEIGSPIVERQYRRQFSTFGTNTLFISKFGRILLDEEQVVEAEQAVTKKINKSIKAVQDSMHHLDTLARINGINTYGSKKGAVSIDAEVISPMQNRFLNLMTMADDELNVLHSLWILGEIEDKARTEREWAIKREIRSINASARNMFLGLRKRVSEKGKEEAVAKLASETPTATPLEVAAPVAEKAEAKVELAVAA